MDFSIPSIIQYSKQNMFQEKRFLFGFTFSDGTPTRCPVSKMCPTWNTWPWTKSRNPAVLGITNKLYFDASSILMAVFFLSFCTLYWLNVTIFWKNILTELVGWVLKWYKVKISVSYIWRFTVWANHSYSGQEREECPKNEKEPFLKSHISMGESYPTLPTLHSCKWPSTSDHLM